MNINETRLFITYAKNDRYMGVVESAGKNLFFVASSNDVPTPLGINEGRITELSVGENEGSGRYVYSYISGFIRREASEEYLHIIDDIVAILEESL